MNLIDTIKAEVEQGGYPDEIPGLEVMSNRTIDHRRWTYVEESVYRRGDEYVMVIEEQPATEEQDTDGPSVMEMFEVEPYQVSVTKYRRKDA